MLDTILIYLGIMSCVIIILLLIVALISAIDKYNNLKNNDLQNDGSKLLHMEDETKNTKRTKTHKTT